jgi:hypothetical protein
MKNLSTSALVLATAALFSTGLAFAGDKPATTEGTVKCSGSNACKGHTSCKTETNACKGKNACKGTGVESITAKECAAKGGKEIKAAH